MRSYRDAILETVKLSLLDMSRAVPAGSDPFRFAPSQVTRADVLPPSKTVRFVANVQPGDEVKTKDIHFTHCQLPVVVDFAFTMNAGDPSAAEMAEVLLVDLQRRMYVDRTLNGLCLDIREEGNSVVISSDKDKMIEGTLFLNVFYRHDIDDPRKYMGEFPTNPAPTTGAVR